ncbi:MAG: RNA polymerase sigma factor [Endomicrobiales bacterium]
MDNKGLKPPFEEVFRRYKQRVFELAFRLFGNAGDAEDVTQEAFIRAYRAYDSFRQEAEVYSWLYRITVNLCREKIRKKTAAKKHIPAMLSLDQAFDDDEGNLSPREAADASEAAPPALLENEETRSAVRRAIESLPEKYAEVIMLRDIGDLPYGEISAITGVSVNALGVRLLRARALLREKLKGLLGGG